MSSQGEVQEETTPTLKLFGFLSRPIVRSSNNPNDVNPSQDVMNPNPSSLPSFKATPFKRLKSHLEKRRGSSKERKEAERTPPHTPQIDGIAPTHEFSQSNETTPVAGPSQTTGSLDHGADCSARDMDSDKKETDERASSNPSTDDDSHTMSPTALARRIHSLLSPIPSHFTLTPWGYFPALKAPDQCGTAESVTADSTLHSTLHSFLSSVSAMNGPISKGRESFWDAMERLRHLPRPHPKEEPREHGEGNPDASHSHEAEPDNVDMSSVMICGPLQPTENTEVEIARSEVVSVNFEETIQESAPAETAPLVDKALPSPPPSPPPKQKEVRVWYPSRTKVSFQAFWWGYRIYLPPPVMRVLSDKSLETAKRAAMITAALTWLISHLPTTSLPPQMKVVVEVIKQIVPIMSYVGGFIAWSWKTIQSFDKGQGVTLSATWLLAIAIVPGTWAYTEPPSSSSNPETSGI